MGYYACIDEENRKRPGVARELYCPHCQAERCAFDGRSPALHIIAQALGRAAAPVEWEPMSKRKSPCTVGKKERMEFIFATLKERPTSARAMAKELNMTKNTLLRDLHDLEIAGQVCRLNGGRHTRWALIRTE